MISSQRLNSREGTIAPNGAGAMLRTDENEDDIRWSQIRVKRAKFFTMSLRAGGEFLSSPRSLTTAITRPISDSRGGRSMAALVHRFVRQGAKKTPDIELHRWGPSLRNSLPR